MLLRQNYMQTACNSMLVLLCLLCFTSISLAQEGWETKAPMPTSRGNFSTCVVDNIIYAVGGSKGIGSNLTALEAYDPSTNTWTTKEKMPRGRGCLASCAVDGIIYAIGGGWYTVYPTVYAYDPKTDTWTTKSPMPTARSGMSVCEVDGIIYAISGFIDMNTNRGVNTVEAYDPKTDTWTTKSPIPTTRAFYSISVVDGIIYVFGGFNSVGTRSLSNVEAYDPVTDVWTIKNDLPSPRAGMATCVVDGIIYGFGGALGGGGQIYPNLYKYNPALDSWTELPDMPHEAFAGSSSIVNEKIYLIGGFNNARDPLSTVYEYTPYPTSNIEPGNVSGTWTLNNSPYYVNGEITIPDDSTLTIEPGVEVIFTGNYKLKVQGRLLAIGTVADTIVFTINDTTGFHNLPIPDGGWGGIRFIDTPSKNDSSKIVYCKLEYGKANTGSGYYDSMGGAISAKIDKLLVSHCMFINNTCYNTDVNSTGGGAIAIFGDPIIEFCEFSENRSTWGSAIVIWGSNTSPLIRNNYFHHNQGHGTINIGSWNGSRTSPVLINNVIVNNHSNECRDLTAGSGHGIVHFSNGGGKTVLINNTIVNNSCTVWGGAVFGGHKDAELSLINNIIYGNEHSQVYFSVASRVSFKNCLIEGGKEGFKGKAFSGTYENCIDTIPQFVDEANGDYHLSDESPCVGAGYYEFGLTPTCDCDGKLRPVGSNPDIGAYENELDSPTDIMEEGSQVPTNFALSQNYPNPFNPSTIIKYQLPVDVKRKTKSGLIPSSLPASGVGVERGYVKLIVYDILGREVATLVNEKQRPGNYEVEFNSHSGSVRNLSTGIYFYQLTAGNFIETKKMILLK